MIAYSSYGQGKSETNCNENVYSTCEKKPQFGSHLDELKSYLKDHVLFIPIEGQKRGIFSISMNCEGNIFKAELYKGSLEGGKEKTIIKTLLSMPKWAPAESAGEGIDYHFFLDFKFVKDQLTVNTFMR